MLSSDVCHLPRWTMIIRCPDLFIYQLDTSGVTQHLFCFAFFSNGVSEIQSSCGGMMGVGGITSGALFCGSDA